MEKRMITLLFGAFLICMNFAALQVHATQGQQRDGQIKALLKQYKTFRILFADQEIGGPRLQWAIGMGREDLVRWCLFELGDTVNAQNTHKNENVRNALGYLLAQRFNHRRGWSEQFVQNCATLLVQHGARFTGEQRSIDLDLFEKISGDCFTLGKLHQWGQCTKHDQCKFFKVCVTGQALRSAQQCSLTNECKQCKRLSEEADPAFKMFGKPKRISEKDVRFVWD